MTFSNNGDESSGRTITRTFWYHLFFLHWLYGVDHAGQIATKPCAWDHVESSLLPIAQPPNTPSKYLLQSTILHVRICCNVLLSSNLWMLPDQKGDIWEQRHFPKLRARICTMDGIGGWWFFAILKSRRRSWCCQLSGETRDVGKRALDARPNSNYTTHIQANFVQHDEHMTSCIKWE